jgi:hypothetical protein
MFRTSDIVLIGVMVAAAAMTYSIKRDAGEQLATVRKLQTQIRTEEETIDLLKADWSLLTQPARWSAIRSSSALNRSIPISSRASTACRNGPCPSRTSRLPMRPDG